MLEDEKRPCAENIFDDVSSNHWLLHAVQLAPLETEGAKIKKTLSSSSRQSFQMLSRKFILQLDRPSRHKTVFFNLKG